MPALRLLVGTSDGLYELGAPERRHLNGHEITALAGDGRWGWALVDGGTGLPEWFGSNIDTGCLTAAGATVAFGTDEGLLFVSTDAGASWERMAKDLPAIRCVHVA